MSATKSSLRSLFLALAVGAIAFGVIWQLRPAPAAPESLEPPEPEAPEPATAKAPAKAADAASAPPEPSPDLPQPGERPSDLIDESYQRALHGMRLEPRKAVELYHHFKEHPRDGRPQLVLGLDAVNRQWYEPAVDHYLNAYRADPQLRHEPRMLSDLLDVAAMGYYHEAASDAVVEIYGQEALAPVEERIERARAAGHATRVKLLEQLRAQLVR